MDAYGASLLPVPTLNLETAGTGDLLLRLREPDGVKAFLNAELGLGAGP